jgi:hypothetical protein
MKEAVTLAASFYYGISKMSADYINCASILESF